MNGGVDGSRTDRNDDGPAQVRVPLSSSADWHPTRTAIPPNSAQQQRAAARPATSPSGDAGGSRTVAPNMRGNDLPRTAAEVDARYARYKGIVARVTAWAESGLPKPDPENGNPR